MELINGDRYVYIPNVNNWNKFIDVRGFFTNYLRIGGLEKPSFSPEKKNEKYDDDTIYDDLEFEAQEPRKSAFEEAGVDKETLREALDELAKWARRTGHISGIKTPPETVDGVFTVELDNVDFYGNFMEGWIDVLGKLSGLSFRNSGNDSVLIDVCVKNVWKVVCADEQES